MREEIEIKRVCVRAEEMVKRRTRKTGGREGGGSFRGTLRGERGCMQRAGARCISLCAGPAVLVHYGSVEVEEDVGPASGTAVVVEPPGTHAQEDVAQRGLDCISLRRGERRPELRERHAGLSSEYEALLRGKDSSNSSHIAVLLTMLSSYFSTELHSRRRRIAEEWTK